MGGEGQRCAIARLKQCRNRCRIFTGTYPSSKKDMQATSQHSPELTMGTVIFRLTNLKLFFFFERGCGEGKRVGMKGGSRVWRKLGRMGWGGGGEVRGLECRAIG